MYLGKPNIFEMYKQLSGVEWFFIKPDILSNAAIQMAIISDFVLVNILYLLIDREYQNIEIMAKDQAIASLKTRKQQEADELSDKAKAAQTVAKALQHFGAKKIY